MKDRKILITIGSARFEVALYDTDAARSLLLSLPQTIRMSDWGDEYYGTLSARIECGDDELRDVFEPGEIALWPEGNALCVFFGPTPASRYEEPRMASPGAPFGKIVGDFTDLYRVRSSLKNVKIEAMP